MLTCLGSVKGSPGVTSFAMALALRWPTEHGTPLVVELDPAGGDLASRWQTREQPGLTGMVLAARRGPVGDGSEWVQRLAIRGKGDESRWPSVQAILAPPAGGASLVISELAVPGNTALAQLSAARPVLADLGRLDPNSPQQGLLDTAGQLLLLVRPTLEHVRHVQSRLAGLRQHCPAVALLLAGPGPYPAAEIAGHLGVPVAGIIPADPPSAALLSGQATSSRGWMSRPLLSAARSLALRLAGSTSPPRSPQEARYATTAEVTS